MASKKVSRVKDKDMAKPCPCNDEEKEGEELIACESPDCSTWWHISCTGLAGCSNDTLKPIKTWVCAKCIMGRIIKANKTVGKPLTPHTPDNTDAQPDIIMNTPQKTPSNGDRIRGIFKAEIQSLLPEIEKIVKEAVGASNTEIPNFNEILQKNIEDTKSTIDVTMTQAVQRHQDEMVSNATAKHHIDNMERERRCRNVVLRGVPELNKGTKQAQTDEDKGHFSYICDVDPSHIKNCFRAGKEPTEKDLDPKTGKKKIRPIIVTVSTPTMAKELHSYGTGRKFIVDGKIYWANQDLIWSERKANYDARMKKLDMKSDNNVSKPPAYPPRVARKDSEDPKNYTGSERKQMSSFLEVYNSPDKQKMRADQAAERAAALEAAATINSTPNQSEQDFA